MDLFQSILANIKQKIDKETFATETIAAIISKTAGITIDKTMIVQRGSHITLKVSPTIKSAVLFKRPQILEAFKKEGFSIVSIS